MSAIEINMGIGERIARLFLSLPAAVILGYFDMQWLFFLPFYLVVTGITGIALEKNLFAKKEESTAPPLSGYHVPPVKPESKVAATPEQEKESVTE